jgi:glycerol kinase
MKRYILALDQGTSSSRAIVFDHDGRVVSAAQQEIAQIYPRPGWVEHDPEAIWESQLSVAHAALRQADSDAGNIAAIGVANQRETTIIWDRHTGQPIANAIVWQCRRTAPLCAALRAAGHEPLFRTRTGLVLDPYFSGTKIAWLLANVPGARRRAERGELAFGTVDTYLIWRLTGGTVHATDPSNASRTLLFNLHSGEWDDELLAVLEVPRAMLPEVRPSASDFGATDAALFGAPIRIRGVAGDQQAATFGQACFDKGLAKNTYGTGCFLLMNTGYDPVPSSHGLLTTIGWQLQPRGTESQPGGSSPFGPAGEAGLPPDPNVPGETASSATPATRAGDPHLVLGLPPNRPEAGHKAGGPPDFGTADALSARGPGRGGSTTSTQYAQQAAKYPGRDEPSVQTTFCLEGSVFIAGAAIQWLRDELRIIGSAGETQTLAEAVTATGGVYFVPAFVGLGAPYWDPRARGAIVGLTRGSNRAHIARAALEAIAYQTRDVLEAMAVDAGESLKALRVDGGASSNNWLMQFQADMLGTCVERPVVTETTALGAAYLAGLAAQYWHSLDEIAAQWRVERVFEPRMATDEREQLYAGWKSAVARVR